MIQQNSMPPVSANVLAALVGSLLPQSLIVSVPGAVPAPAIAQSFPNLPLTSAQPLAALGTAQSGQAFSGMLVDQLAAAIVRAEKNVPIAGGTAPPQAASPPLWAATAPSGLADVGESPGQQVVDQTGTSAGGVRPSSPAPIFQIAASRGAAIPQVSVSLPTPLQDAATERVNAIVSTIAQTDITNLPAVESLRTTLLSALTGIDANQSQLAARTVQNLSAAVVPLGRPQVTALPVDRAPLAAVAQAIRAASPEELVAIVRRAEAAPVASGALVQSFAPSGAVVNPIEPDPAANRVSAAVATLAQAAPDQPATIEVLRTSLLTALAAVDPPRTPAAAQVVRQLTDVFTRVQVQGAAAVPADAAVVTPSASPVPALAQAIREASPAQLVALIRQTSPEVQNGSQPVAAVAPPVTSFYASLTVAPIDRGALQEVRTTASVRVPDTLVITSPAIRPESAVVAPVEADAVIAALPAVSPAVAKLPATGAVPVVPGILRAAVQAYGQTQPDAPFLPVTTSQPEFVGTPVTPDAGPSIQVAVPAPVGQTEMASVATPVAGMSSAVSRIPVGARAVQPTGAEAVVQVAPTIRPAIRQAHETPSVIRPDAAASVSASAADVDVHPAERSTPRDLIGAAVAAGASVAPAIGPAADPGVAGHGSAVAAAIAQMAQESAQTPPGTVREIALQLHTADLGIVRVRLALDHAGGVRVDVRAASEEAAQALRTGLPQLADALAMRNLDLSSAAVQVMSGAGFGGSHQSRQQPQWFERTRKSGPQSGDAGEPVLAGVGAAAPSWTGRGAAWGRGPAGVDVLA